MNQIPVAFGPFTGIELVGDYVQSDARFRPHKDATHPTSVGVPSEKMVVIMPEKRQITSMT